MSKNLYIISGCNGAGKTTASFTILPEILNCKEFVNADEIAKGLSPFQPEKVSFEAGRIMLSRINDLLEAKQTFAFETTLATKSYKSKIIQAQKEKYHVTLLFFWLETVELAIERVKTRVIEGGHNIETEVIKRRYLNGIRNLFEIYLEIVDEILIFDNSFGIPELIAEKSFETEMKILNEIKFNNLKKYWNERI
ncbi:zeta toxin family protein [Flavobacterium sp.]|uniref:zeta toxin family protein n=1 Tax=Flavobacterium sp. TaxID=239 RepID=UPI002ED8A31E